MIDKILRNLSTIRGVAERKITTCLRPLEAGEFCNLVERPVELSKLFNQRRRLSSFPKSRRIVYFAEDRPEQKFAKK